MSAGPDAVEADAAIVRTGPRDAANPYRLWALGAVAVALTAAAPFAFRAHGDNAYIALALLTGLVALAATSVAQRTSQRLALWTIAVVAILLRVYLLFTEPLLSTDVYRYVWDGIVQGAGINPYRYFPAHEALSFLRDNPVYPNINRADYAVTIYPPAAQMFFFLATRLGASVVMMKLALLACEAVTVLMIVLLLRRLGRPATHIVAYAWHPLPLWEIANNGHIDALMVSLLMLGLWLAVTHRPLRAAAAVTLGALAKPFAVLALPAIWRPWNWKLPLVVVAVAALCYLPYLSIGSGALGFLTRGYLTEERFSTGEAFWPLATIQWVFGFHGGNQVYLLISALLLAASAIHVAFRQKRSDATMLADVSRLLMVFLFLLSPNYPWYFLALTPFVALVGGAPLWVLSVGAVLLQDEVHWDPTLPIMVRKTVLYVGFLAACMYAGWRARRVPGAAGG
ncbi:MAG: glycosyltransferase 87 family protein [Xanthobacteraceae bacterium]